MTPSLSFNDLSEIAESLAVGFEALQNRLEEQRKVEDKLRQRLASLAKKHRDLDISGDSSDEYSDWREEIVRQISPSAKEEQRRLGANKTDDSIGEARSALHRFKESKVPSRPELRKCPMSRNAVKPEDLEHDFTTQGKPSDLGCPFAKKPGVFNGEDPIAAEFHVEKSSTRSQDAFSRCPIRFLDKHSPEEVAKYFENHKHEIPRSHEICVKRYQTNESSMRQLDAKYGNLVSMIQGLGNKHKPYLPEQEKALDEPGSQSNQAVEKWAETVNQNPADDVQDDERVPRFEKSLRDIRVGESPSRPWGIPVPADRSPAASASLSVKEEQLPADAVPTAPTPIADATAGAGDSIQPQVAPVTLSKPAAQINFNGPVFLGYAPDQAATFLQYLNISPPA